VHDADARVGGGLGRRLPVPADPGQEGFPGGPDSSTCCSPVSPYQPTAEAETSVVGGGLSLASTPARARVPGIRLDLISAL